MGSVIMWKGNGDTFPTVPTIYTIGIHLGDLGDLGDHDPNWD